MTIRFEMLKTSVTMGKVYCKDCDRHKALIFHGYGEDAEPLDAEDKEILDVAAETHDKATLGTHDIIVYLCKP